MPSGRRPFPSRVEKINQLASPWTRPLRALRSFAAPLPHPLFPLPPLGPTPLDLPRPLPYRSAMAGPTLSPEQARRERWMHSRWSRGPRLPSLVLLGFVALSLIG